MKRITTVIAAAGILAAGSRLRGHVHAHDVFDDAVREQVGGQLRDMMPWIKASRVVDRTRN